MMRFWPLLVSVLLCANGIEEADYGDLNACRADIGKLEGAVEGLRKENRELRRDVERLELEGKKLREEVAEQEVRIERLEADPNPMPKLLMKGE